MQTIGGHWVILRRATLAEILALRHAVLRPGLPLEEAMFDGDEEEATRHFGAFLAATEINVACLSLMSRARQNEPAHQLRGMATRPDLARQGLGRALLHVAEETLRAEGGASLLWCNARLEALGFYARLGWQVVSGVFDIPGVGPHRVMVWRLPPA